MFYVLNFETHTFTTCDTTEEVSAAVNSASDIEFIEIIDAHDSAIRLTPGEFDRYCEVNGL